MDPTLGSHKRKRGSRRTLANLLLLGLFLVINPGCRFDNWFKADHGIEPLQPHITHHALVEHLNKNIRSLHSWSCTDATISTKPSKFLPVKLTLNAQVAVERDKNFRLRAQSPFGDEADFGSNSERFWFWMRRNRPNHIFTAKHAEIDEIGRRMRIPFHPTWIMEALGVVPLDPNAITVSQPGMEPNTLLLVSEEVSPSNETVRREIIVDTHFGVILAHRLFASTGQLLAEARLANHRREPSGIIMPHRIELNWPHPEQPISMTMELSQIDVNPSNLPEGTWRLPENSGYQVFDMGRRLNHVEAPPTHEPAGERTTNSQVYLEPPPFADQPKTPNWQPTGHAEVTPTRTAIQNEPEPPPFY